MEKFILNYLAKKFQAYKKDLGSAIYELYINFMKDNFEDYEIDLKANAYTF